MTATAEPDRVGSPRREELLDLAYRHVLAHGLADMSLRPLAKAVGSSPRVLLFLFGSKDNLVRHLLDRARAEELVAIARLREDLAGGRPGAAGAAWPGPSGRAPDPASGPTGRAPGRAPDLVATAREVWRWLSAPEHRALLGLWVEAYARSLVDHDGPWAGFARHTVDDWLGLLAASQPPARRRTRRGEAERTAVLALLRGALLDLLATGDADRTGRAVDAQLDALAAG